MPAQRHFGAIVCSMDTTDQQEKHAVISDICSDDDARELANLGKKPVLRVCITSLLLGSLEAFDLQLQRNFSLIAILGLSCTLMVTWEGLFSVFVFGLQNGGPAGLIYGFLFVWIGYGCVVATMGELVSMWPTAG